LTKIKIIDYKHLLYTNILFVEYILQDTENFGLVAFSGKLFTFTYQCEVDDERKIILLHGFDETSSLSVKCLAGGT
jgi:hypothetical protein